MSGVSTSEGFRFQLSRLRSVDRQCIKQVSELIDLPCEWLNGIGQIMVILGAKRAVFAPNKPIFTHLFNKYQLINLARPRKVEKGESNWVLVLYGPGTRLISS